ncbi:MAG: anthranilate phosphoribosyltransferase [Elusimicrobia bacterium CG06_land_8_20_14_3_00_38_11]|nr:MAG: anthranilate phosphoribosyltransferase [Elusimicrobia bacterium CG06_land_8_20_14_3_00_38_11]
MIKEAIAKVVQKENLTEKEAIDVMTEIMTAQATESQIASFITALRMKGETIDEITGCAKVMREHATKIIVKKHAVDIDRDEINIDWETIVDTCGTGGDKTKTFNVSTATAFVAAGAGVVVAKHGNRAVSSKCGSADVLEELGINLELPREKVEECINKIGIGFLYAPLLHSAMKYAIGPRRQIGIRTIFNILGPLTNPAGANAQVLGVYSPDLTETLAFVLKNLGSKSAFVVHGIDAIDEISITGKTQISELKNGIIKTYTVKPEDFGLKKAKVGDIAGGDAKENAKIILDILTGKKGPKRDIVLLNTAAVLTAAGKSKNFKEGIELAQRSIDLGKALKKFEELKKYCGKG